MPTPKPQGTGGAQQPSSRTKHDEEEKKARKAQSSSVKTKEDIICAFTIPSRYKVQDVLGQGAYGVVVSALDTSTKQVVAVKKIERVFDHETFTKRTLREIRILKTLDHENIISLKSVFASVRKAKDDFDDLYLVFELMETDLASIIKSPQPLTAHHVQFFIYQVLRGLKFLHSAGIIHRDIKPRNLLVNSNCDLKICDMGLARFDTGSLTDAPAMTDYIATRWYRAPEIILQWDGYGKPMDMWSVGCILGELLLRKPLFPGGNADQQIHLIVDVLGRPSDNLIRRCPYQETIDFLRNLPPNPVYKLSAIIKDTHAVNLVTALLQFDPAERHDVGQCLKHPYLAQLHFPQDEPESPPMDLVKDFPYDAVENMPPEELLAVMVREVEANGCFFYEQDELKEAGSKDQINPLPSTMASTAAKKQDFITTSSKPSETGERVGAVTSSMKKTTPRGAKLVSKSSSQAEDSSTMNVHSPLFESSQDSLPPGTPKTPSTPSNVSIELGRLGAALDELRAM